METNTNTNNNRCAVRVRAYKNAKTMEQCKEEAKKNTELCSQEILNKGKVSGGENIRSGKL